MLRTICMSCRYGDHDNHHDVIQMPREDMIGGISCPCRGECGDGRYNPEQSKKLFERFCDFLKGAK